MPNGPERVGEITSLYDQFAETLENDPNYPTRKTRAVAGDMTLEQYVAYCRKRSAENYTNETAGESQERFQKYLELLK